MKLAELAMQDFRIAPPPGKPTDATAYNTTIVDDNSARVSLVDLLGADSLWFLPEGTAGR
jgi:hypothetical protein